MAAANLQPSTSPFHPRPSVPVTPEVSSPGPQSCFDAGLGYMPRAIQMEQAIKVHKCDGHGKVDWRPCEVNVQERYLSF